MILRRGPVLAALLLCSLAKVRGALRRVTAVSDNNSGGGGSRNGNNHMKKKEFATFSACVAALCACAN